MFEQTLMPTTRNSPWTLGASITLQSAIVGTMVLYSALHVDMLPFNNVRHLELPMPPSPPPREFVKVIGVIIEHRAGALIMPSRAFRMPAKIPNGIAQINDIGS